MLTDCTDDRFERYAIPYEPVDGVIELGSCTGSAPTRAGWQAAVDTLERFDDQRARLIETMILRQYRLAADTPITVCPSGTDAELVALAAHQPEHTIIVGAEEIGSGSPAAARGRHFTRKLPTGGTGSPGQPVVGIPQPTVWSLPIRDGLRPLDIASTVQQVVDATTRPTLLHVVDVSKTGWSGPFTGDVDALERSHVTVVVDAAQSRRPVGQHVGRGRTVIVTGSKFWQAPPFCAAVIGPADVPPVAGFTDGPLPAVYARWAAAIAEMARYQRVDAGTLRNAVEGAIRHNLDRSPLAGSGNGIVPVPVEGDGKEQHAAALAAGYRLGQPLTLAGQTFLRLAVSGPLASDVAEGHVTLEQVADWTRNVCKVI